MAPGGSGCSEVEKDIQNYSSLRRESRASSLPGWKSVDRLDNSSKNTHVNRRVHQNLIILYIKRNVINCLRPQVHLQYCSLLMVTGSPCRVPSIPGPVCWPNARASSSACLRKNRASCPRTTKWAPIRTPRTRGAGGPPCYSFAVVFLTKPTTLTLNTTRNGHTPNTPLWRHPPRVSTPTPRPSTRTRKCQPAHRLEHADSPMLRPRR